MSILRLAQSPPPSVAAATTAQKAVKVLRRARCGALIVLDKGRMVGVLSERDLVHRVVGKGLDPRVVRVSEIMTTDVAKVGPDATWEAAFDLMTDRHIRHLAIVDARGRPVGLLSLRNLAEARIESAADQIRTLQSFAGADSAGG
jgi:CBS domain-containing protein